MADHSKSYDFIVIGAGTAGATLTSQLAQAPKRPSVLLVEAGGTNGDLNLRIGSNKLTQHREHSQSWSYASAPNAGLNNRVINLDRGKGLGGTSAVNGTFWTEGLAEDMERMVRLTGDEAWRWEKVKERYNKLTRHHFAYPDVEAARQKYISPKPGNYGTSGPLHVGYSQEYNEEILGMVDIWDANGVTLRSDANDGNLLGMAVFPLTAYRGIRTTSADLLYDAPPNLEIITATPIHRVLFQGTRAIGIATIDGRTFSASKEVILCGGALDSPKILLHSGIGLADQLTQFNIPLLHENSSVGQNFQDHLLATLKYQREEHTAKYHAFLRDKAAQKAALREWQLFRTGPMATSDSTMAAAFVKSDALLKSAEHAALPPADRAHLESPSVPAYEILLGLADFNYAVTPETTPPSLAILLVLQHMQSRGSVTLQSADPTVPLLFNSNYFSSAYDHRLAIEGTRETMRITHGEAFQKDNVGVLDEPKSDSDEDIVAWWREKASTCWHMSSTCTMGREEVEDRAVVDDKFRVFGVQGLRVVDNSVWPFCPTAHLQAHAYQLGLIGAEKLVEEYGLARL